MLYITLERIESVQERYTVFRCHNLLFNYAKLKQTSVFNIFLHFRHILLCTYMYTKFIPIIQTVQVYSNKAD